MKRLLIFLVLLLPIAGAVALIPRLDEWLLGSNQAACPDRNYPVTRHRSGTQPRSLSEGLKRRACTLSARAARDLRRQPMEFDFDLIEAAAVQFPAIVDSNSPAFWEGGSMHLFNSAWMESYRSSGETVEDLTEPVWVDLPQLSRSGSVWIEAVWLDPKTSLLYGWYHFEPADLLCLTAPIIGAAVSYDFGVTWEDRGFILESRHGIDCDYDNGYFVGGNGDFSVVLGPNGRYFYFLFTNYAGTVEEQGVAVARSRAEDLGQSGAVFKFHEDAWTEPGLGGKVTPIFPSSTGWKGPHVESFWGPSVHWNTYLNSYVGLLNHTDGENWSQEGVYLTFSRDLTRWTAPRKLLEVNDWYPQVIGLGENETDSVAGQTARVYVGGISNFIIRFALPATRARSEPELVSQR